MKKDQTIDKIVSDIKNILAPRYHDFKGIYFYGSRSRGDFHHESDYDFILVFERKISWQFKEEIKHLIYPVEHIYEIFIDIRVMSQSEIESEHMPLIQNIKREGVYFAA